MDHLAVDLEGFRAFEAAGWSARAVAYDRFFAPISARLAGPLLDAACVDADTRVLDLASGPGYIAAQAAGRGAPVLGIDISPEMVRLASTLQPALAFHQADAEHLPFADGAFDAVLGNLLLPHLADPERCAAEAVRVLAPAGRLALTVWDVPARSRLMGIIVDAVQEVGAGMPEDLPPGPPVFRFADDRTFTTLLRDAGLIDIAIQTVAFAHALPDADAYWDGMLTATVRTAALVDRQRIDVQRRIREAVDRLLAPYATPDGLALPVAIKLGIGRRPG